MADLGRLKKVDLRDIWRTEAQDFTPWLARPDNLQILAETLNMELELEAEEKDVGPFRADILAKDTDDGSWVLIENQLEKTDHLHLGQLLTYAAGLQTVTIVWVAARFVEEHRAALDWLNEVTDERFRFFGLEVELWRIGDSPAAPKFNIISKPNEWTRSVEQAKRRIENEALSETKAIQLKFWTAFRDYLINAGSPLRPQKPFPQHWTNYGVGRSGFMLGALLNSMENRVGVELYINHPDAKALFRLLERQKDEIEQNLGFSMDWEYLPDRKGCRIVHYRPSVDPLDESRWDDIRIWMKDRLERLDKALRPRIRNLNAEDFVPEIEEGEHR